MAINFFLSELIALSVESFFYGTHLLFVMSGMGSSCLINPFLLFQERIRWDGTHTVRGYYWAAPSSSTIIPPVCGCCRSLHVILNVLIGLGFNRIRIRFTKQVFQSPSTNGAPSAFPICAWPVISVLGALARHYRGLSRPRKLRSWLSQARSTQSLLFS